MTTTEPAAPYPASFSLDAPTTMARWRPLVQWILAIPHLIIAGVLGSVSEALAFISWFAILFTGKLPAGLAEFQAMTQRYSMRTFAYSGFLYEDYPPFDFTSTSAEPGGSPVSLAFEPELEDRNRLTVAFRIILAIPAIFVAMILFIAAWFVWLAGFFAILFTGSWPAGMRTFIQRVLRFGVQVSAYMLLLTDRYPPLALD